MSYFPQVSHLFTKSLLLQTLTDIVERLQADRGCVLTSSGIVVQVPDGEDFPYSRRVVDSAIDLNEPLLTADAITDLDIPTSKSLLLNGARSILCLPFKIGDEEQAVVYLDTRKRGLFNPEHLKVVGSAFSSLG